MRQGSGWIGEEGGESREGVEDVRRAEKLKLGCEVFVARSSDEKQSIVVGSLRHTAVGQSGNIWLLSGCHGVAYAFAY